MLELDLIENSHIWDIIDPIKDFYNYIYTYKNLIIFYHSDFEVVFISI